ncbi:MAG: c-type cytochrome [Alphaproteobacteria bacterium]|nr:c-type cytochrome [Alphaproteobacteria bacterium]
MNGAASAMEPPVPHIRLRQFRLMVLAALLLPAAAALADPKAAFVARCAMCHQAGGEGLAGQFPRLAGRAAAIAGAPAGRRYLVRVVLHGMAGPIEVEGTRIAGVMPGMASLSDADIAAVLSHAISLGKPARPPRPVTPAEVAAVRGEGPGSMADNRALRAQLVAEGLIK